LEQNYLSALLLGLFGSLHCIGMCGSISSVLTFSLPQKNRDRTPVLIGYLGFYNLGRLLSYTLAGTLAGAFGSQLLYSISPHNGHKILLLLSTLMIIAVGLYLAGWFPKLAYIERIGVPFWRRVEPLGRKLLPVKSPFQALLYGMIWGWLPCGLVYSALLIALTQGQALHGGVFLFVFGLGTLPSLLGSGFFAGKLLSIAQNPKIRAYAGLFLIILALTGLGLNWEVHEHQH
jgi:uncharacterized protein